MILSASAPKLKIPGHRPMIALAQGGAVGRPDDEVAVVEEHRGEGSGRCKGAWGAGDVRHPNSAAVGRSASDKTRSEVPAARESVGAGDEVFVTGASRLATHTTVGLASRMP